MINIIKKREYYHDVLLPCRSLIRAKLEEDYAYIKKFGIDTPSFICTVAMDLTAYNELSGTDIFFRMRDFEPYI